jgi:hypothetical protein
MKRILAQKTPNQIQSRLLGMAGFFLFLYSVNLTLAPAVRARTWAVDYSWNHWIGFLAWVIIFIADRLGNPHDLSTNSWIRFAPDCMVDGLWIDFSAWSASFT